MTTDYQEMYDTIGEAPVFVVLVEENMTHEQATMLGMAVFLGKPILVIAAPGQFVSTKLLDLADEVIRTDVNDAGGLRDMLAGIERQLDS